MLEETGNFTIAAQRLGITQPAVSHSIRQLEEEFGAPLFLRQRDRTAPTAIGRLAVREARLALLHVERLDQAVRGEAMLQTGRLRLACFSSAVNSTLPAALAAFARRHPAVELDVRELADETCVAAVREQRVDLGMVNLPCADLTIFPLFEDALCLVLPEDLAPPEGAMELSQLGDLAFVHPRGACDPLINAAFVAAAFRPRTSATVAAHSANLTLALVREGAGFTIMPAFALIHEQLAGLAVRALQPSLFRRVAFAASSEHAVSPAARAFLDILEDIHLTAVQAADKQPEYDGSLRSI